MLPSTLESISAYAFQDCTGLVKQILPSKVASIDNHTFSGCYNLEKLYVSETLQSVADYAFYNCDKLCLYCPMYSWATEYALANDIAFISTTDEIISLADSAIDYTQTFYAMDLVGLSSAGTFDFTFEYKLKDEMINQVSDLNIVLFYPTDSVIVKNSLKRDGVTIQDYLDNDHEISFSVPAEDGRIRYSVTPNAQLTVRSYASISYRMNGETHRETVGIINESLPVLTLVAPESVSSSTVTVSGVAVPMTEVRFSIGDTYINSTFSRRSGKYSADLTIPNAQDYKTYTITARSFSKDNLELTASAAVQYAPAFPELTSFIMNFGGSEYDLTNTSSSPVILFSDETMEFDLEFTNPERVSKVYVVSERNNVCKYMEATWNQSRGCFVASGYFEPDNTSYVPGTISVQYQKKGKSMSFTEEIDFQNDPAYVNTVDDIFLPAIANPAQYLTCVHEELTTGDWYHGDVKLPTIDDKLEDLGIKFDIFTDKIPSWLNPGNATENGYQVVENDAGEKLYMMIAEDVDGKIQGEIIDFIHEKSVSFAFDHGWYVAEDFISDAFALSSAFSTANKIIKYDNTRIRINVLEDAIMNSKMSDTEKQAALRKVDTARRLNFSTIAIAGLCVLLPAAGITFGFPVSLILPALAWKNSHELSSILDMFGMAGASESGGIGMNFRWKIDPSGYVYEAVTENRLAGVKATAYYKDENGNVILWNAEEWDQLNPVFTDSEGRYAWDVPEGMWQVKYELDGYETVSSDWMPVPPPQTDVNIGIISLAVPTLTEVMIKPAGAKIRFSKYMDPTTVSAIRITDEDGNILPYELIYSSDETAADGTVYAIDYVLQFTSVNAVTGKEYSITLNSSIRSYAGVGCTAESITVIGRDENGELPFVSGWQEIDGKRYYYDENGNAVTGWKKIEGIWYYFDTTGIMQTGWQKISSKWYYFDTNGAMQTGWQKISNKWYYFNTSGVMQTGFVTINRKTYYFNTNGAMQTGWQKISDKWYYFNTGGDMVTGWKQLSNKWYFFSTSGVMQTGWQKISDKWYYFNTGGDMVTGWKQLRSKWYYFSTSGVMQTGWQKISEKWYYFNTGGDMVTGWKQLSSKWYYFSASGVMQTGWQKISGKTYFFKSSGIMAANEWCSGWWLNKDGTWTYKYQASWKKNSKGWYFQDTSGWYAKNTTITIDGKSYSFDANGYWIN